MLWEHALNRPSISRAKAIRRRNARPSGEYPLKMEGANVCCYTVGKRVRVTMNFQTNVVVPLANADRRLQ